MLSFQAPTAVDERVIHAISMADDIYLTDKIVFYKNFVFTLG